MATHIRLDDRAHDAYVASAEEIGSDYERDRALTALRGRARERER